MKDLLQAFVANYMLLYGKKNIVYNVHNLVHIADDAARFGALDNISAFPFESFLGRLKKMVRRPQNPVAQIVDRICEKEMSSASNEADVYYQAKVLKKPHSSGPLPVHVDRNITCEYRECIINGLFISCLQGDNCFAVDDDIGLVQNIIVCDAGQLYIVYKQFTHSKSFFPCSA